jgi:hypothetical protein
MDLPKFIVTYSHALLSAPWRFSLVYLSRFTQTSHDYLTRNISKKYDWKLLLWRLVPCDQGYLVIDETDVDKTFAKIIPGLGWVFSNNKKRYIFGLHIVVLAWTNNEITIPLGWKIYWKGGGKTKIDLALELIKYGLHQLQIQPHAWLFDSFYAATEILKYLSDHNQTFYSQLPKSRLLDHVRLEKTKNGRPYWTKIGLIKGRLKVQVIRNRKKYFVTNAIGVSRKEQLYTYKIRWRIEEIFRFVKHELGFEKCQSTKLQSQHNHFGACFLLYGILQVISFNRKITDYKLKLEATRDPILAKNINLAAYFACA